MHKTSVVLLTHYYRYEIDIVQLLGKVNRLPAFATDRVLWSTAKAKFRRDVLKNQIFKTLLPSLFPNNALADVI